MRKARVLYKKEVAAELIQNDGGDFVFRYLEEWFTNSSRPSVSLTLPKSQKEYRSKILFSFFYNMLPEGSNKKTVCFQNRIDENDAFGVLLTTAAHDTIGAVTIERFDS
jgi:serine/threonine-protein kinase HipA